MDNVSEYFSFLGLNKKKEDKDKKLKPPYPGTLAPLTRKFKKDEYMSRVDVEDHIIPIWERETDVSTEKEPVEDLQLSYSYSLLSFVSRSITEGTVSSYESDQFDILSESDIEENEVRGVYLHELQHMTNTEFPSPDAYPVYIKGITVNGNTVECIDASPYSQQFPVILYEWFVGIEYNSIERYSPEPLANGKTFKIPTQAIGKYIFCRAHRLVEAQINTNNTFLNSGPYDPHIYVYQNNYPNQKKFHNISTLCSAGPVDISNDLALKVLENLSGEYYKECTLCYTRDFSSCVTFEKAHGMGQILEVELHITSKMFIKFKKDDLDEHYVFSEEFFEDKFKEDKESNDLVLLELSLEELLVQESNHSESEILFGIYDDKKLKYYFSLKFEDRIQCVIVLYTIKCFLAKKNIKLDNNEWNEALIEGNLDYIVKLLREYFSSL